MGHNKVRLLILKLLLNNGYKFKLPPIIKSISKKLDLDEKNVINNIQYLNIKGLVKITEERTIISHHVSKIDNIIEYSNNNKYSLYECYIEITKTGVEEIEKHNLGLGEKEEPSKIAIEYVSKETIRKISKIDNTKFDFTKLIALCKELNVCYENKCYYSTMAILRTILNHIPPLFGHSKFKDMIEKYKGGKSFQEHISHLEKSSRKISDNFLHQTIRKSETNPTQSQVQFGPALETVLLEIIRKYK